MNFKYGVKFFNNVNNSISSACLAVYLRNRWSQSRRNWVDFYPDRIELCRFVVCQTFPSFYHHRLAGSKNFRPEKLFSEKRSPELGGASARDFAFLIYQEQKRPKLGPICKRGIIKHSL